MIRVTVSRSIGGCIHVRIDVLSVVLRLDCSRA
jgi:hypothetical protein